MDSAGTDDGSIADLPWASVFDPAANARVLSSVQARGFRAATEVVNRFVKLAENRTEGADSANADRPAEGARADADQVLLAWQKMFGRVVQSLTPTQQSNEGNDGNEALMDLRNASAAGQVVLESDRPGAVSTEVWLHNGGPVDMGKVALRCSDLLAHDGAAIGAASVRFEPDAVPMYARSSRGVTVEVDVSEDVRPGRYRGTLLAEGHEDVWLPVLLVVAPAVT